MEQTSLLSQSVWLELPLEIRAKLAQLFSFPEKGSVNVIYGPMGPKVISDGYGYSHLKLITTEKMQEMLGTKVKDFYELFHEIVRNIDDLLAGAKIASDIEQIVKDEETLIEDIAPKKRGRPKKS